ncbi:MAG: AAA family ATPase [Anaerolineae bacterium]|nr:AAA family ATPase [Anaerolineae bacterium]
MSGFELVRDLIRQFSAQHPNTALDLSSQPFRGATEQRDFAQLIDFARALQDAQPVYEAAYLHLVHQFVLRGSRANLLAALERRLQAAVAGQSSLILIEGVSGIGKTSLALVQAVRAQEIGAAFVVGRCHEHGATPFWLWQEVVRAVEKRVGISASHLAAPFGQGAKAESVQHLLQSLANWLGVCAAVQPLVILLDDLHWADSDSLEVLNRLVEQLEQHSILFISTYRSDEAQHGHPLYNYVPLFRRNRAVETLRLQPLTRDDTAQLVTAYRGPFHPHLADYLYQRAEGHPLFTIELLHDLFDQGLLTQDASGQWLPPDQSIPVPRLLKQVIIQRVSRLGEAAESLLLHAAVMGETWALDLVEHLVELPEDTLLKTLEDLLKADLIRVVSEEDELYQFSHGLIREVLYTQQHPRRRKRLHERVGTILENKPPLDFVRIAHHFYEADIWQKAAHFCYMAGREAARSFANNRALDWYHKALDALRRSGTDGASQSLMNIYEEQGRTYRVLDQLVEAEADYNRMHDAARALGDLKSEGHALISLVNVRIAQYRTEAAEQTAQQAIQVAEQLGDAQLQAQAHAAMIYLLLIRGQFDAHSYHVEQFRQFSSALQDHETHSGMFRQQAYAAIWSGHYADGKAHAQQCLDYGLKSGNLLYISGGYQVLSFAQIEAGDYADAYQNIRTVLDQTEQNDPYHHQLPRLLNQMGYLFLELGAADQALAWDQRALAATQVNKGVSRYEMRRYCLLNIATDLLHLGRLSDAQAYAGQFEAMMDAPDYARFRYHNRYLLLLTELHLAERDFDRAVTFAQESRAFAQEYSAAKNIAKSHWFEGLALLAMQQREAAVQHLRQGVADADAIQHGSLRWKIRLNLAQALRSIGESSVEPVQAATVLISQTRHALAGSPLQDVFNDSYWLAQLDNPAQQPLPEKMVYPAGLTQREVEILRLVASGATNQQIADALTISPRTVNTHITNILNKTGCENRTAASAFAMKHNLLST